MRALLEESYKEALRAASPERLLWPHLTSRPPALVVAVGKAARSMLRAAREAYPDARFLAVPPADGGAVPGLDGPGEVLPAAHPLPDERSVRAAERALDLASRLESSDELLVLLSGGGSALLSAPLGVTLEQKQDLARALMLAGADIRELNTVRRHLSRVKGGGLARATRARVRTLLLSDVVGDHPSDIASGPTVPDPTTYADALAVLDRYRVGAPQARAHLERGARGELAETLKSGEDRGRLEHVVIGSNFTLLAAARNFLEGRGQRTLILSDRFEGEARALAALHAALVESVRAHGVPAPAPLVLLSGGEATVRVLGDGVGGRNQEFALALLDALRGQGVWALSAGSDGIDGSSGAAGAFLTPDSWARAAQLGLDPRAFLERNDSGGFFARLGDQLVTGPSGHNLNDFRAIAVG